MTDESWALGIAEAKRREQAGQPPFNYPYYIGTAALLYVVWVLCGGIGAQIGPMLGDVERFGFGMAFPAVFLVLVRGMWRGVRAARPWLVSLITAAAVYLLLPHSGWYVPAGTAAGLLYVYFFGEEGGA